MKTSTSVGKHGIQWTSRMQLDDLDFADDLAHPSQTQQQMQEETISVATASAEVDLNIHKGKREDLEDVKTFTYLGSIIDEQVGSDADMKARIGKARAAYLQLRNIWNSKQLSTNTKKEGITINVIQCYAPTNNIKDGDKDQFYEELQSIIVNCLVDDLNIMMGDLNIKVRVDNNDYEDIMGRHGLTGRKEREWQEICKPMCIQQIGYR
ncbi:unnamed protein product [Schistosoma margrebowiei]|uniref:Uncharacterized protein n=1 Tax=Schistosoma margrebowiei TaxID=48269 RepID=A0A183LV75_9TREM|nr:unnamed protein product [Schistosoma margrebowiei]